MDSFGLEEFIKKRFYHFEGEIAFEDDVT